ncbi:uncharacterized protein TNCV_1208781 [Trichonephila clavipes]|nr:uncharacterized protein TNCV_1208781 [Trichonephila clavipes]
MMAAFVLDNMQENSALQSALSNDIPGVMVWGNDPICYELRKDNARPHVTKNTRDFGSVQHMQFVPRPNYSLDILSIEHMWDLVGQFLVRDPRPEAS